MFFFLTKKLQKYSNKIIKKKRKKIDEFSLPNKLFFIYFFFYVRQYNKWFCWKGKKINKQQQNLNNKIDLVCHKVKVRQHFNKKKKKKINIPTLN